MNNAAESAELKAACFDLARTAKWAQRPIDSEEITELAGKFESVAVSRVYEPLNIDVTLPGSWNADGRRYRVVR
jgi:hypothetical protein